MELIVLVDKQNNPIGTAEKDKIHTNHTPLHRAFSCFIFNSQKKVLLTKRALTKKTFPGVWTNTVCGHPGPEEDTILAIQRRLKEELNIEAKDIKEVAHYRYRFADKNGIVENEICPIFVGWFDSDPKPNPQEVSDWKWMNWWEFLDQIKSHPGTYSPWSEEEALILEQKLTF